MSGRELGAASALLAQAGWRAVGRYAAHGALLFAGCLACTPDTSSGRLDGGDVGVAGGAAGSGDGVDGRTEVDAGAGALCGEAGEACCPAPLPLCSVDLACGENGRCATRPGAAPRSRLCTQQGECGSGETCCPMGAFGICSRVDRPAQCPRPDLAVRLDPSTELESRRFSGDECEPGCRLPTGDRRLLRFSPAIINLGDGDAIVGTSNSPGIEEECGGMFLAGALHYELIGASGSAAGDGHLRPGSDATDPRRLGGSLLGLAPGFYDTDAAGCQWLDISGLAPDVYTLRVTLALDGRIPDANPDNDVAEVRVDLSADLLEPCGPDHPGAYQSFGDRDCGWLATTAGSCVPGAQTIVGCSTCSGVPNLRVCEGSEPCTYASAEWLGSGQSFFGDCPGLAFTCPPSGSFVALGGTGDGSELVCDVELIEASSDPLAECGVADQLVGPVQRDCGWTSSAAATCVPGELVEIGCPVCDGDPVLRVCAGSTACLFTSEENLGSVDDSIGLCPTLELTCPASGSYTALVSSYTSPSLAPQSCDIAVLSGAGGGG